MAKSRPHFLDFFVYLAVRFLVCIIQSLSPALAHRVAESLAWLVYKVDKRHRLVALDNLRHAFPGHYSDAELDRLVRNVYRHFCSMVVEMIHLPRRLHCTNWRKYMKKGDFFPLVESLLAGRPILMVTGHLGNWELASYGLGMLGVRLHAIARDLDNPYLDRYMRQFRQKTGQRLLAKKGDFDQIQEVVRSGGILGTLADQDAGPRGMFVDFFGRPASTHKAIALMAMQMRALIVVAGGTRAGDRYVLHIPAVIYPEEYDQHPDPARAITQRFTTALESIIRQYPEQYFWLHRRWKHQPVKRKSKSAA